MGFIKTIFGSIFGLIGGLFKAIVGIFGIGKKSEFYLEADDADGGSPPGCSPPGDAKVGYRAGGRDSGGIYPGRSARSRPA